LNLDNITNTEISKGSKQFNDIWDTLINDNQLIPVTGIKSLNMPSNSVRYGWGISHPDEDTLFYKNT
jgi:hypothetical protein